MDSYKVNILDLFETLDKALVFKVKKNDQTYFLGQEFYLIMDLNDEGISEDRPMTIILKSSIK
jgi:hypothetical protein